MKKLILLFALTILSCNQKNNEQNVEISILKRKNDSLKSIINTLNTKFIFDNIKHRFIASEKNSDKLGSEYEGEFVIVGYNRNDKVEFTTKLGKNGIDFEKPETLKRKFGGFQFKTRLNNQENYIFIRVKTNNKYGRNYYLDGVTFADKKKAN
jgi:hypothetical protein